MLRRNVGEPGPYSGIHIRLSKSQAQQKKQGLLGKYDGGMDSRGEWPALNIGNKRRGTIGHF